MIQMVFLSARISLADSLGLWHQFRLQLEGVGFFQVFDLIDGVHELINEVNMMMEGV
jgi:hypothetical protein